MTKNIRVQMTGRSQSCHIVFFKDTEGTEYEVPYTDVEFMVLKIGWNASLFEDEDGKIKVRMD